MAQKRRATLQLPKTNRLQPAGARYWFSNITFLSAWKNYLRAFLKIGQKIGQAVEYPRWKPYAGKPRVRFCAGCA